ncbi:MAG: GGDEF domain-containing protein [Thermodesulfobacteriota bacterium]|nr:GGDEF domain-containing protein [Thermodesulfobacteriota bacterium]
MIFDTEFHKVVLDNLYDGVYYVDLERNITYWNKGAEKISGYASSDIVGKNCSDNILLHINDKGENLCKAQCPLAQTIKDDHPREKELYLRHKDGYRVPVLTRISPVHNSRGQVIGAVEIFSDNSPKAALLQRVEELQKMALYDSLTGLANRRYMEMSLDTKFNEMFRYGWPFGVFFIDIDLFKNVNDTHGHLTGDKVLKMVAKTLSQNTRPFDILGRWGGEEFIAIIVNVNHDQLYSIANKFRILIAQSSLLVGSDTVQVTISIGATLARPSDTIDLLLQRADQVLYNSKALGRNCVSVK